MEEDNPFFNASLKRLEQLMKNLDELEQYSANDHALGMFANLRELKKKSRGYLSKEQNKTLSNKWERIKQYRIKVTDDRMTFDSDLLILLHNFDEWLQLQLHKNGIIYKGSDVVSGLAQMKRKYKLDKNGSN